MILVLSPPSSALLDCSAVTFLPSIFSATGLLRSRAKPVSSTIFFGRSSQKQVRLFSLVDTNFTLNSASLSCHLSFSQKVLKGEIRRRMLGLNSLHAAFRSRLIRARSLTLQTRGERLRAPLLGQKRPPTRSCSLQTHARECFRLRYQYCLRFSGSWKDDSIHSQPSSYPQSSSQPSFLVRGRRSRARVDASIHCMLCLEAFAYLGPSDFPNLSGSADR